MCIYIQIKTDQLSLLLLHCLSDYAKDTLHYLQYKIVFLFFFGVCKHACVYRCVCMCVCMCDYFRIVTKHSTKYFLYSELTWTNIDFLLRHYSR